MTDTRDGAARRRHYEIEKELANVLRTAPCAERPRLYREIYNELFRRVPDHPQNSWKEDPGEQAARTSEQLRLLDPFLTSTNVYLEVGAGDCYLAQSVASRVRFVYAVDVSAVISATAATPRNFALLISDGSCIPAPNGCANVVYSNMLLEHLHPDDVDRHLQEVRRVLAPGGVYVCRTPHRFSGPQDISQFFDREATGLHLKEYTVRELAARFQAAGFTSVATYVRVKGRSIRCPDRLVRGAEATLGWLPHPIRKRLCTTLPLRVLFHTITVVARTSGSAPPSS